MKHAYLIHGWSGKPEHGFFPWLRRELEARGYVVEAPEMPDADTPAFEKWVPFLEKIVGVPDQDTLLLGHSMGGQAILRYLERLPIDRHVGAAILVAPVVETITNNTSEDEEIARAWLERPFDADRIRRGADRLIGIFSDDDPYIPLSSERVVREQFDAQAIILPGRGHFSGDGGCTDLPEILKFL